MVAEEILEQKHDSAAGFMIKGDAYKGLEQVGRAEEMYLRAINSAELYITPSSDWRNSTNSPGTGTSN